nr:hypothetical protein [Tanacetum cinerariifolium]
MDSSDEESKEEEERLIKRKPRGVGLRPKVPDEPTGKSAVSDEGAEENPKDIPWESIDDDETKNDDEEDVTSIDIEKTDDERMDIDVEDQEKGVEEMNIVEEAKEEIAKKVEY